MRSPPLPPDSDTQSIPSPELLGMAVEVSIDTEEAIEAVEQRMLDWWISLDASGNFKHPPADDDELHDFIQIALGYNIPRKVVTLGHKAPFEFVADLHFERVGDAIAFANRLGSKTVCIAILNFLDLLFKPTCEIANLGATRDQARKCFTPETQITLWDGTSKPISEIAIGDRVLTLSGKSGVVTQLHPQTYTGELIGLKTVGRPDVLWATPDHEIYVSAHRMRPGRRFAQRKPRKADVVKVRAEEILPGDYCVQPDFVFPHESGDYELGWLIGMYVAEGSRFHKMYSYSRCPVWATSFGLGTHEKELGAKLVEVLSRRFKRKINVSTATSTENGKVYRINSRKFFELVERYVSGRKAKKKKLTPRVLDEGAEFVRGLLAGHEDGDGCKYGTTQGVYTASPVLAQQLSILKPLVSICTQDNARSTYGGGLLWRLQSPLGQQRFRHWKWRLDGRQFFRVRSVHRKDYDGPVYDFGVDVEHSYLANRVAVSNCFKYITGFMALPWFKKFCERYEKLTGEKFVRKEILEETTFANKATQQIITATEKGVRGPHPHKARFDEIDEIEWDILQTGLSMARSDPRTIKRRKRIAGQNTFTSTRQKAKGSMQRFLDEAPSKGIEVYQWNVWEVLERCDRRCLDDPKHGTCPVYTFCKGKAHSCAGFMPIEDFIQKIRVLDREKFETEWLNLKPSKEKLVYFMFDNNRHVMTRQRLFQMTGSSYPRPEWRRVSGLDFGSSPGHPFVYVKLCQLPNGAWMVFFEYVAEQKLIRDHAKAIKDSPYYLSNEWIFADHDAQDRLELQNEGVRTKPAKKDVLMGINYVKELLSGYPPIEEPMLYIFEDCTFVIEGFGAYSWPTRPDGKPDLTGKPKKVNDDEVDATRYGLFSLKHKPKARYRARRVPGI